MRSRLPKGAWEALFPRALVLVDEFRERGGIADPFWTLGGGTVLMLRYGHWLSKDIDVFVPDPQYLGYVTPRLSDRAADLTQDYTEAGTFVKLQFEEGEIDFVAAPNLLSGDHAWENWEIMGRTVKVETAAEIIAKKMYHRGHRATARDLFDFAAVALTDPDAIVQASPFFSQHGGEFLRQIHSRQTVMQAEFDAIDRRDFALTFEDSRAIVTELLRPVIDATSSR